MIDNFSNIPMKVCVDKPSHLDAIFASLQLWLHNREQYFCSEDPPQSKTSV